MRGVGELQGRLFSLFFPGAELTLHASVHSGLISERAMLMEALDQLGPDDVLVLDRGYPAAWLAALLNERGIRFVMRCDNDSGWSAVKNFIRSGLAETRATLKAPKPVEVRDLMLDTPVYIVYFGQSVAYLRASETPFSEKLAANRLGADEQARVIVRDFARSSELKAMVHTGTLSLQPLMATQIPPPVATPNSPALTVLR